jgi:hypothetical protein
MYLAEQYRIWQRDPTSGAALVIVPPGNIGAYGLAQYQNLRIDPAGVFWFLERNVLDVRPRN